MRLGVPGAVTRFYYDHREGPELSDYVTTIARFLICSSLAIGGIALLVGPWLLEHLIPGLAFYPYGLLVIASATISCNQNLQDRLVQVREQASYAAKLNIGRAGTSIVLALVFVLGFRWGAFGMLLAELVAAALFFIQACRYLLPNLHGRFRPDMLRTSVKYALGILPSHFMVSVAPVVTRSVLADASSLGAVGQLGIAGRFMQPLTVLGFAFQTAFVPIYFALRNDETQKSVETVVRTAALCLDGCRGSCLGGALLIPAMIRLLTPEQFHTSAGIVPILCLGFLGQTVYSVFAPEIYYSKRTYLVPLVSGTSLIVTILITVLTVKEYGAFGIAWATSLGILSMAVTSILLSQRLVAIPHCRLDLLRIGACGAAVAAVAWMLPVHSIPEQLIVGSLEVLAFPLLLWVSGDPTVRGARDYLRERVALLRKS